MRRSTDRIIVSHAGTLPRSPELRELMQAGDAKAAEFKAALPGAVKDIVRHQVEVGIDVVNDGELGKRDGFSSYPRSRHQRHRGAPGEPGEGPAPHDVQGRDRISFPEFGKQGFPARPMGAPSGGNPDVPAQGGGTVAGTGGTRAMVFCVGPISYIGQEHYKEDIANLKAATAGPGRRALPACRCSRHDGALDVQRVLQERRGDALRHRRRDEGRVQGDHRRRLRAPDRRPGPAGRLADVPEHDGGGVPQVRPGAHRGPEPRPRRPAAGPHPLPHLLGQPARPPHGRHRAQAHRRPASSWSTPSASRWRPPTRSTTTTGRCGRP